MIKTLLAVLTVLAVLMARFILKLPLLPFRALRGMLRGQSASA